MPKKKVVEETEEVAEEEAVGVEPEAKPEPQVSALDSLIAEAPELADVIKNPWLYSEWLHKLRGLQK